MLIFYNNDEEQSICFIFFANQKTGINMWKRPALDNDNSARKRIRLNDKQIEIIEKAFSHVYATEILSAERLARLRENLTTLDFSSSYLELIIEKLYFLAKKHFCNIGNDLPSLFIESTMKEFVPLAIFFLKKIVKIFSNSDHENYFIYPHFIIIAYGSLAKIIASRGYDVIPKLSSDKIHYCLQQSQHILMNSKVQVLVSVGLLFKFNAIEGKINLNRVNSFLNNLEVQSYEKIGSSIIINLLTGLEKILNANSFFGKIDSTFINNLLIYNYQGNSFNHITHHLTNIAPHLDGMIGPHYLNFLTDNANHLIENFCETNSFECFMSEFSQLMQMKKVEGLIGCNIIQLIIEKLSSIAHIEDYISTFSDVSKLIQLYPDFHEISDQIDLMVEDCKNKLLTYSGGCDIDSILKLIDVLKPFTRFFQLEELIDLVAYNKFNFFSDDQVRLINKLLELSPGNSRIETYTNKIFELSRLDLTHRRSVNRLFRQNTTEWFHYMIDEFARVQISNYSINNIMYLISKLKQFVSVNIITDGSINKTYTYSFPHLLSLIKPAFHRLETLFTAESDYSHVDLVSLLDDCAYLSDITKEIHFLLPKFTSRFINLFLSNFQKDNSNHDVVHTIYLLGQLCFLTMIENGMLSDSLNYLIKTYSNYSKNEIQNSNVCDFFNGLTSICESQEMDFLKGKISSEQIGNLIQTLLKSCSPQDIDLLSYSVKFLAQISEKIEGKIYSDYILFIMSNEEYLEEEFNHEIKNIFDYIKGLLKLYNNNLMSQALEIPHIAFLLYQINRVEKDNDYLNLLKNIQDLAKACNLIFSFDMLTLVCQRLNGIAQNSYYENLILSIQILIDFKITHSQLDMIIVNICTNLSKVNKIRPSYQTRLSNLIDQLPNESSWKESLKLATSKLLWTPQAEKLGTSSRPIIEEIEVTTSYSHSF